MCDKLLKGVAEKMVKSNVNSCCMFTYYQPNLPKGAGKYKKY